MEDDFTINNDGNILVHMLEKEKEVQFLVEQNLWAIPIA